MDWFAIWSCNRICWYMYHKFNLFATTIYVDVKKNSSTIFYFFNEIITANDMHIIVSYCSISFLDICWFLLTTKNVALWLAAHPRHSPAVDIGLSHPRETKDPIPVDYSFFKHSDHLFIIIWFLQCRLLV